MRFITVDGKVIVFPQRGAPPDWVSNVLTNPRVRVLSEGGVFEGNAKVARVRGLDDPLLAVFTRKYGRATIRSRYWGQTEYVEIEPVGGKQSVDYNELVYGDLEAAFDGVASDYDRHIFGNPINMWLRNRSVSAMASVFRRGQTVLEVGCGTGTETISIAKMGIRVVAVDISSKMLEVLRAHAKAASVADMVIPIHCRPYQIRERLDQLGVSQVDGAYSTYGAVNTEPRLPEFFSNLHSVISDGGELVLGVWNKFCLYEILGYTLKANPSMALARLRNPVPVGKSRFCVSTNAYSVRSLSELLAGMFKLRAVRGVGIFLPPSNLTRYLPPVRLTRLFQWADLAVEGTFPWSWLGDHFLALYTKAERPTNQSGV